MFIFAPAIWDAIYIGLQKKAMRLECRSEMTLLRIQVKILI